MPILDIEIVGNVTPPAATLAQALADEAGRLFAAPPATTWVRVRWLAREAYAEDGAMVATADLPVFVTVLKRQVPERVALAREMAALARAVARVVGRPAERIHVEYAAAAAGRIAFGGVLVE
jgi:phenylpyruvate tautomerase PptA (4-oxalocrotonate tautomerase family)